MERKLAAYYARRAAEYEEIYRKPERQQDLKTLTKILSTIFKDRQVLEIACGTGYWTRIIASSAASILALDCNKETLEIARRENYQRCPVTFLEDNAYTMLRVKGDFTAGFCGFWWSHIPKERLVSFMVRFHSRLRENALVVMVDNNYVEGSSTPIARQDDQGNTYQTRRLADGSEYEILKNFPTPAELKDLLSPCTTHPEIINLTYYWLAKYSITKGK